MTQTIPIVKEPDRVLRLSAREVLLEEVGSKKIQKLIEEMKATLKNTPDGVGLAAPQVGESLRIFIVSSEAEEIDKQEKERRKKKAKSEKEEKKGEKEKREWKYVVFINPSIKKHSKIKEKGVEGCLSIPGKFGFVKRYEKITVEACNENGTKFTHAASHFSARVLQHELDHLEGKLFIDRADEILPSKKG